MRARTVLVAIAALLIGGAAAGAQRAAGDRTIELTVGGARRSYRLHVPTGSGAAAGRALVILLHGNGGTGAGMARLTHFDAVADSAGLIAAYPDGIDRSWADGRGVTDADRKHVDDLAFLEAMVDDIARHVAVDRHRVYLAGISNGGFMAQRAACDRADRYAAVAIVDALLPDSLANVCRPSRPIAVMLMVGTDDPLVPFDGGEVRGGRGRVRSATETSWFWARVNQCGAARPTVSYPDRARDGTTVSMLRYDACAGGSGVRMVRVDGGGHTWPGGIQYLPRLAVGRTSRDVDASVLLLEFFGRHRRQ